MKKREDKLNKNVVFLILIVLILMLVIYLVLSSLDITGNVFKKTSNPIKLNVVGSFSVSNVITESVVGCSYQGDNYDPFSMGGVSYSGISGFNSVQDSCSGSLLLEYSCNSQSELVLTVGVCNLGCSSEELNSACIRNLKVSSNLLSNQNGGGECPMTGTKVSCHGDSYGNFIASCLCSNGMYIDGWAGSCNINCPGICDTFFCSSFVSSSSSLSPSA